MRTEFPYTPSKNWSGYGPCLLWTVELSTLCLVLISASVDFHKVKRGLGRPTRLLPHGKMLLIPIKLFLSAG